jgi:hypothetical protein
MREMYWHSRGSKGKPDSLILVDCSGGMASSDLGSLVAEGEGKACRRERRSGRLLLAWRGSVSGRISAELKEGRRLRARRFRPRLSAGG